MHRRFGELSGDRCPDINEELTNANNRGIIRLGSVTGTDTIPANAAPYALTSYDDGQHFTLKPALNNTGAVTLNVSGIGPKAVVNQSGAALVADDLIAATIYTLQYYGADGITLGSWGRSARLAVLTMTCPRPATTPL